jgi:2-aminoadipate transaminase
MSSPAVNLKLARRMDNLRASEIRELLKLTQRPEVISFAGGLPAAELFPTQEMAEVTRLIMEREGASALQYSSTEGDPDLRRKIAARMNARQGTHVEADDILITSGSQQGLEFTGKVLIDEGDAVLCESPTYVGALNAFRAYCPRFIAVETDDDGMVPQAVERALRDNPNAKFIYAIPDFQNPSGRTWSLARRRALLEIAAAHEIAVLEDCPYADLRFEGEPLPALKALDEHDLVIFLGSFSKIFCPGLRTAWLAAPQALRSKYVLVKQGADLHTGTLVQRQVATYIEQYDLDANIARLCAVYRERRDTMLRCLEQELPAEVTFTRPEGGLFLWVTFPAHANARELLEVCVKANVAFVPGGAFYCEPGHENTARLNFSYCGPARIEEGCRRFGKAVREFLG